MLALLACGKGRCVGGERRCLPCGQGTLWRGPPGFGGLCMDRGKRELRASERYLCRAHRGMGDC